MAVHEVVTRNQIWADRGVQKASPCGGASVNTVKDCSLWHVPSLHTFVVSNCHSKPARILYAINQTLVRKEDKGEAEGKGALLTRNCINHYVECVTRVLYAQYSKRLAQFAELGFLLWSMQHLKDFITFVCSEHQGKPLFKEKLSSKFKQEHLSMLDSFQQQLKPLLHNLKDVILKSFISNPLYPQDFEVRKALQDACAVAGNKKIYFLFFPFVVSSFCSRKKNLNVWLSPGFDRLCSWRAQRPVAADAAKDAGSLS